MFASIGVSPCNLAFFFLTFFKNCDLINANHMSNSFLRVIDVYHFQETVESVVENTNTNNCKERFAIVGPFNILILDCVHW